MRRLLDQQIRENTEPSKTQAMNDFVISCRHQILKV